MDNNERLQIHANGTLRAVVGDKDELPEGQGQRYRVLLHSPELLILRRDGISLLEEPHGRVLMAGQIISHCTILEIVNLIASSRWVGTLRVYGADSCRTLGFYNGALRHAQSDHPEDRLDKVLSRVGVLSPAQVESVMRGIKPGQRFGELLVEKGLVDRQQLFVQLGRQMEQILLAAVLESEGTYVFTVADDRAAPPSAVAHIPLQRLLLDAAERVDKLNLFQKLVPDVEGCPVILAGVDVTRLESDERLVLGYCDGTRSVRAIGSETWLGLFQTLETVYDLVRLGCVELRPPYRSAEQLARSIVEPFNLSLTEIFQTIEADGRGGKLRQELRRWVVGNDDARALNGFLGEEGYIEVSSVTETLRESSSPHRLADLRTTLHELTSFALFTASLWLPREQEEALSRRINNRLEGLRA